MHDIHWKIATYPELELTSGFGGRLIVGTTTPGEADITGAAAPSYGGAAYSYGDRKMFTVSGTVALDGNQITFQPDQD